VPRFRKEALPGRRQLDGSTRSLKQLHVKNTLQDLDLPAEWRLRHVHTLCGPAEMHLLRHRHEATQEADIKHGAKSSTFAYAGVILERKGKDGSWQLSIGERCFLV